MSGNSGKEREHSRWMLKVLTGRKRAGEKVWHFSSSQCMQPLYGCTLGLTRSLSTTVKQHARALTSRSPPPITPNEKACHTQNQWRQRRMKDSDCGKCGRSGDYGASR
ncbi:hypothetical protein BaRGS_00013928 [Batillaria attramentaria]|uniref:Uncharacterized protein n=1 Tax=Batillaria attramentaria TaxID=370345 RepID=A0ABD0L5I0_9CAEN